jgi:diguanylate cyclase (GGDEF)-like protein
VGVVNILIARLLIERRLSKLTKYMYNVNQTIGTNSALQGDIAKNIEECPFCKDSNDEIGESAKAFNELLKTLLNQFSKQYKIRYFTNLLNSSLELEVMAEKALEELVECVSAKGGAIAVEQNGELEIMSSYHMIEPGKILESKILWEILKTRKRRFLSIPDFITIDGVLAQFRPAYTLIEPIVYKDVALGLIILSSDKSFEGEGLELFDILVNSVGLTIKNALAHKQLARLAAKDPLTDVYNRRFGLGRLQEEYSRSVRNGAPVGVAMLDIDHFKNINDAYGHVVGDKVLSQMAKTIHDSMREGDIPVRYGGEEFLLILPGASISDSKKMAERLRRLLSDLVVTHLSSQINFTVSIGVASFPECDVNKIEDLVCAADSALYEAKEGGRNQVIAAVK